MYSLVIMLFLKAKQKQNVTTAMSYIYYCYK